VEYINTLFPTEQVRVHYFTETKVLHSSLGYFCDSKQSYVVT
jgi:hypothetical protein